MAELSQNIVNKVVNKKEKKTRTVKSQTFSSELEVLITSPDDNSTQKLHICNECFAIDQSKAWQGPTLEAPKPEAIKSANAPPPLD